MIRVLVVDDSALVRKILTEQLGREADIEVVGSASDPYVARERIAELAPDVLTLDIEMPRMDGLSFLATLMKHHPMPVVIVSSLAPQNSDAALRALSLGALEVVSKPGSQYSAPRADDPQLARAIRAAAGARVGGLKSAREPAPLSVSRVQARAPEATLRTTHGVLAVGASTGGTQAVEVVVRGLPADGPGTLIVQHMPCGFTETFARRLDSVAAMQVREAREGDVVSRGLCLVAPGGRHMIVRRSGTQYVVRLVDTPRVHFQRPAVDVLFQSVAQAAGQNAAGLLLTGMGTDGAEGLLAMRRSGAWTAAQDEETCVVYGMPKEAVRRGAAEAVLPLGEMAAHACAWLSR